MRQAEKLNVHISTLTRKIRLTIILTPILKLTSFYQLTLLQRIITAINDKRRLLNNEWDNVLGYNANELKRRADPLRTVDLGKIIRV